MKRTGCATEFAALDVLPVSSVEVADTFVLVEMPLPWPSDVTAHPYLVGMAAPGVRLQALVPAASSTPTARRVVLYRRGPGGFDGFHRRELVVDEHELVERVLDALRGSDGEEWLSGQGPVRDVLVCTHGSRDRCCGADGMRLFQGMTRLGSGTTRVWRTSHTGGHRYAPTGLTFPDGYGWAYLTPPVLRALVERDLPAATAAALTRGCAGLDDPWAQAADAAALGTRGWGWMTTPRRCANVDDAGATRRVVTIEYGTGSSLTAEVEATRTVSVPTCGGPPTGKSCHEYAVRSLTWS